MTRIVIVGASLAGAHAARAVRRAGFDGELVLVGEEPHLPYDRPPLSKEFLVDDEVDEERLRLRPTADPDELSIEWRLGRRAVALDGAASRIELDDGEALAYDGLVVATGARPRELPGAGRPEGLHVLRTLDDARSLRQTFHASPGRVVVCGAGFIGAEVAASARSRGLDVTMVDAAPAPLDRVLDRPAGMAIAELHRGHGVDVRLDAGVASVDTDGSDPGRVRSVALSDGTVIEAGSVVIGIGVIPNVEWLGDELTIDDGLVTDATCLAGPRIVAAGDVCRWPNRRFGDRMMRVEQWDNAVEMGGYAGRRLVAALDGDGESGGEIEPFEPVPWFWSDQYDRKIQLAGLAGGAAEVVAGGFDEDRLVQIYLDDHDRLQGALCWNRPRQAVMARQLIAAGASAAVARERLAG